jgi:hypothetical protein
MSCREARGGSGGRANVLCRTHKLLTPGRAACTPDQNNAPAGAAAAVVSGGMCSVTVARCPLAKAF